MLRLHAAAPLATNMPVRPIPSSFKPMKLKASIILIESMGNPFTAYNFSTRKWIAMDTLIEYFLDNQKCNPHCVNCTPRKNCTQFCFTLFHFVQTISRSVCINNICTLPRAVSLALGQSESANLRRALFEEHEIVYSDVKQSNQLLPVSIYLKCNECPSIHYSVMLIRNKDPYNRKMNPVSRGVNA